MVAIGHDYVTQRGGAERVVLSLLKAFPQATLYTTFFEASATYPEFLDVPKRVSPLNRVALLRRNHRLALPLLPFAASAMRVPSKVMVASSSGWAHGFRCPGVKIVYCYSPARWLYQSDAYLGDRASAVQRWVLRLLRPYLIRWDKRAARSATKYLAISNAVRARITDIYGVDAEVLPAPHNMDTLAQRDPVLLPREWDDSSFFLCVARLLPYKNVERVVEAFSGRRDRLVVVGRGPLESRLRRTAPPNVLIASDLTDAQMRWLYCKCRGVVAASYEDYGLTPLEAAAFGKPAVVLRWGGFLDTVISGVTGIFFDEPNVTSIESALDEFDLVSWDTNAIRIHASRFSEAAFISAIQSVVAGVTRRCDA